jgi:hypothetical protein
MSLSNARQSPSSSSTTVDETSWKNNNERCRDYGHYMKVSLVLAIEMYLLRQRLLQLSEGELERHIMQVSPLH